MRRQSKNDPMTSKSKFKKCEKQIFVNDDFTFLRARLAKALRQRHNITTVYLSIEKMLSINLKIPKLYLIASFSCMNGIRILFALFANVVCIFVRSPFSLHFETLKSKEIESTKGWQRIDFQVRWVHTVYQSSL